LIAGFVSIGREGMAGAVLRSSRATGALLIDQAGHWPRPGPTVLPAFLAHSFPRSDMMTKTKLIGGAIAAAALLAPAVTLAQDDPYAPLGIRSGAFLIFPSLSTGVTYDDNVFATNDDEDDDFFLNVRPEVRAESQWSRHSLVASAFGDFGFYKDNDDNNYEDFGAALAGQLDVLRNSRTTGTLGISRLSEDREDADDAGQDDVTQYWQSEVRVAHRHEFVRFFVQPSLFAARYNYESAGNISNAERDYNSFGGGFRAGVTLSPRINVFGEVNSDLVRYDDAGDDDDSNGADVRAGVEVDFTRLVVGEASLGYAYRQYDEFENEGGLAGDLGITWTPTQLTTVDFVGSAGFEESTVVFEGDRASGSLSTGIGVIVNHDLRRNIRLNASARYDRDEFQGTDRVDDTFRLGAGVSYLLNRNLSVDATYRFDTRDSDADNEEFDRNIFRIGLTARL
jgi:hypothetical protein